MLKPLTALTALVALASCQSQPPATEHAAPPAPAPAAMSAPKCYSYTTKQDTVYLTFSAKGPAITGTLLYQYAEKDRNRGSIRGAFSGDTLRADYTFLSEGVTSVREVVFVKRGAGLIEGYGPVAERAGKTVFEHPHHLKFDGTMPLVPVACRE